MDTKDKLQYFFQGEEYVTRYQICEAYNINSSSMQRFLETQDLTKLVELNRYYFLKSDVESVMKTYVHVPRNK